MNVSLHSDRAIQRKLSKETTKPTLFAGESDIVRAAGRPIALGLQIVGCPSRAYLDYVLECSTDSGHRIHAIYAISDCDNLIVQFPPSP